MNVVKALLTVVVTGLVFGAAGGTIGGFLGEWLPGFYRFTLRIQEGAAFDPVEVGTGLGITQGVIGGMVIGVVIVAIIAWRETRLARGASGGPSAR